MSKEHRLKPRKSKALADVALNFLLGCADLSLASFELARLDEVANLRKELQVTLDRMLDQMAQAALAGWFRSQDRNALRHAIENKETPEEWAARMIRNKGRSVEEIGEDGYAFPLPALEPGAAHLAASLRYQQRNIAEGKCQDCPEALDRNSVRYCTKHLAMHRDRQRHKKALSDPGSREFLYSGEVTPSTHGRQPGTLASLEMNREKKTRAVLAELGIPPESAVSLKAAKEALLKIMPTSKAKALPAYDLFQAAQIPTGAGRRSTTGYKALQQLLYTGEIGRFGKGGPLDPYRCYFASSEGKQEDANRPEETRKPKHRSRTKQSSALLKVMRGEERNEE